MALTSQQEDDFLADPFGFSENGEEQQQEDNRIRQYLSDLNNRTNDPEDMMLLELMKPKKKLKK